MLQEIKELQYNGIFTNNIELVEGLKNDCAKIYINANDKSPSWTGVQYFYDFMTSNTGSGPFGEEIPLQFLVPGDVIQLGNSYGEYYHSLVVMSTSGQILVSAHTNDALNRPLDSYTYAVARYLHIQGVRSD